MNEVALTPIGSVYKPRGLKGELLLKIHHLSKRLNQNLKIVWLGENPNQLSEWEVEYFKLFNKNASLKLRKVNSRREAEFLRGLMVFVSTRDLVEDPWLKLVGFKVMDKFGQKGYGRIVDLDETGNQNRFVIELDNGNIVYYPAVENLIEKVDASNEMVYLSIIDEIATL